MSEPLIGYIDPSSGFIILQGIIAAIVGSAVFFRQMIWQALSVVLGRGKGGTAVAPEQGAAVSLEQKEGAPEPTRVAQNADGG